MSDAFITQFLNQQEPVSTRTLTLITMLKNGCLLLKNRVVPTASLPKFNGTGESK